jgi:hypothetical protein
MQYEAEASPFQMLPRSDFYVVFQGYVVLNRPWAFVQWLQKATIKEE